MLDYSNNEAAFLYSKAASSRVAQICVPLQAYFGAIEFAYLKIFQDSRYLMLFSGSDEFSKQYFQYISEPIIPEGLRQKNKLYFLWPTCLTPLMLSTGKQLFELLHSHNIWHGMSLCYMDEDYIEMFAFCWGSSDGKKNNLFINNLKGLDTFAGHFKQLAADLINPADKKVFATYRTPLDPELFTLKEDPALTPGLLDRIKANNITNIIGENIRISKREQDCLALVGMGKTSKEIAAALGLSYRTVEDYINKLKKKAGCTHKSHLIEITHRSNFHFTQAR